MAQQLIDFGSFPDDPTADAIRTAFQKVQQNFGELYSGSAGQAVYSVNRTPGAGITVNAPVGNVVVTANIACVQVQTSTLSIGITANGGQNAVYTQSNQVLVIDLPNEIINIKDITISGNLTANRVTANNDMYTGTLSATGNANVANLNSANNVTGTNLTITNGMMSGNLTLGNLIMSGVVKSDLVPTAGNNRNLGSSANNWNVLYTQDIVMGGIPVQGIGYVSPSFGNVYLPANVAITGTTSGTATTVLTFTVPNSGYYRINTLLIADPASTGSSPLSFGVFDNTGTLVPNSEILITTSDPSGVNQKLTGSGVIDIEILGAYTYTIKAWGTNSPNIVTFGVNGRSSVNWLRLDPVATISTTANITFGNLTVTGDTQLNTVSTTNNANIGGNLNVSQNAIISGNLTVNGNIVYINVEDLSVEDPIINLQTGPNGAPLVANTGKDVGLALNYFSTSAKKAWMGWDNSASEITFGSDVTIASEVVSYTSYANVRAGNVIAILANGTSNIQILNNANINFAVNGNGNRVEIGEANTYVNNQLWANSNIYIKNTGTGPSLFFQDDVGSTVDTYLQYLNATDSVVLFVNGNKVIDSNISNTFVNSPLTANANLIIPNGNQITFVDDLSTVTDTSINYDNANDSITITVNGVKTIQSNVANTAITGNVIISGNLAVDGNITYINTEVLAIEDPIIQLQTGPNGALPVANSGKDIGTALNYYDSAARVAFMGWDVSNVEFGFASRATITNEVVAFDVYGNVRAGNVIARLANGTSNIFIAANSSIYFSANGNPNIVEITACTTYVNTQLYANNNMFINNSGSGSYLYFVDDVLTPNVNDTYIGYDNSTDQLRMFVNNSEKFNLDANGANVLNGNLNVANNITATGDLQVNGGDFTTTVTTFNLLNTTANTINFGGAANTVNIGAATGKTNIKNNLDVDADISMDGGDFIVTNSSANLMNTNANTINAFGVANVINIGSGTGTVTIANPTLVGTQTTQNVYNTTATTVNAFGAADLLSMGASSGTLTLRNPTLVGTETTQNVYNTTATTVNAFGAGTDVNISSGTGNTTIKNNLIVDGNLTIDGDIIFGGCDFDANCTTVNLFNVIPNTVNFAGNANIVNIGAVGAAISMPGNVAIDQALNFNYPATIDNAIYYNQSPQALVVSLNGTNLLEIQPTILKSYSNIQTTGNTITTSNTGFNLINTVATSVNAFGSASTVNIGANSGVATLRNPTLVGTENTQNVYNTVAQTVNFAGAATSLNIGAPGGLTTFRGNLFIDDAINFADANGANTDSAIYYNSGSDNFAIILNGVDKLLIENTQVSVTDDLAVNGGDITSNQATFNLLNVTPSTINFAANASTLNIGNTTGTLTLRNPTVVGTQTTQNLYNTVATTINFGGTASNIFIGNTGGLTTFGGALLLNDANTAAINFRDVTSANTLDTAIYYNKGSGLGGDDSFAIILNGIDKVIIENTKVSITDDLEVKGGDITTNQTAFNLLNTTATTVNFAGAGSNINIGANTGNTTVNNNLIVKGNLTVDADIIFSGCDIDANCVSLNLFNSIPSTINFAANASTLNIGNTTGTATLRNPTLVGTETTQNVYNTTATTVNAFGAATSLNVGAAGGLTTFRGNLFIANALNFADANGANTDTAIYYTSDYLGITLNGSPDKITIENTQVTINDDLVVKGGDITTNQTTFNILNGTATTVNAFGAASTLNMGATTGTATLANPTLVGTQTTQNVYNTTATTVNAFGAASSINIGAAGSLTTLRGNLFIANALNFADANGANTDTAIYYTSDYLGITLNGSPDKITIENTQVTINDDLVVKGGDIITNQTTFNLLNTTATTVNAFGAASSLNIGATTGTATLANPTLVGTQATQNVYNTTATTVNFAGAGTNVNVGAATGNTTVNNNLIVKGNISLDADILLKGCDVTTDCTTFNLINANATTVFFAGAATSMNIGANGVSANIRGNLSIDKAINFNTISSTNDSIYYNSATFNIATGGIERLTANSTVVLANANLQVTGTEITTNAAAVNLANTTTTTINFGGAATTLNVGAATGNTTIKNNLIANGNIETVLTTLNLANANSTTVNFAGAGTQINIGASTGNTKVNNNLIANGNIETVLATLNLANANSTTVNFAGAGTAINIGAATGNTTVNHNLIANGNIETKLTTLNIANANSTTVNFAGAGTNVNIGASTGNTTVNNNLIIKGNIELDADLILKGCDLNTNCASFNLINANATTVYFAGAGTTVEIGATTGNTNVNNNLIVDGNVETVLATLNLANANSTTINFGGAATIMNIGKAGTSYRMPGNLAIDKSINFNYPATLNDAIYFNSGFLFTLSGVDKFFVNASGTTSNANLYVNGTDIITSQSSFNIANTTATTINLGRAASQLNFGAASSNSAFSGNIYATGNINVNGGGIDGPATMNIGSTSSTIQMGSVGGVVTMNGNANVTNLNASANVVATTALKTGPITLNGGNGFIYTNGDITGNTISASGVAVMYPNGFISGTSFSTPTGITLFSNGTAQATLFSGSGASLSSLAGANVTGTVANATYATSAGSASTATNATNAGFATNSGYATSAGSAGYATSAGSAGFASCAGALVGSGCDVAEFYAADDDYEVGTVLEFGGEYDVTISSKLDSHKVAGVISTEPGVTLGEYVEFASENKALLALVGRVPTKVIGPVEKGDLMVSAPDGYAIANNMARAGTIIGKSLENFYGDRGVIDIVVGRH